MTREERLECIERIRNVDLLNSAITIYDDFYDILSYYDSSIADDLLANYVHEDTVVDCISQMSYLQDIQSAVECLDAHLGIYHDLGCYEYEDADMFQLKQDIIEFLEDIEDEDEEDEEESADNNEKIGGKELTVNKESSLIHITDAGIFWMAASPEIPTGGSGYKVARVTLHFSKVQYSTRNSVVTSLQPDTNQPFKFVDCKGKESTGGDLYAQFTLNQEEVEDTEYKGTALKQFTEDWKSEITPVVHGIHVNGNVSPTSTSTFTYNGVTYNSGAIKLDLSPYAPNTEIAPQIIKVGAAQEREVYGITYLGLPAGRSSSLRLKFEIPGNYSESPISFKLRMQCIATIGGGSYATATVSYYKVCRANTVRDIENLATETEINCPFTRPSDEPHKMFEVESSSITVNAGDTVIIIIYRDADTSYNADLAIARINGILNIAGGSVGA